MTNKKFTYVVDIEDSNTKMHEIIILYRLRGFKQLGETFTVKNDPRKRCAFIRYESTTFR